MFDWLLLKNPERVVQELTKKAFFFNFDNLTIQKSKESLKIKDDLGFILPENPPYSPDIAPSDFWLYGFIDEKRKEQLLLKKMK